MSALRAESILDDLDFPLKVMHCLHPTPVDPHSHDFTEIVYVTKGAGQHTLLVPDVEGSGEGPACRFSSYAIMEGDIFAIAPGEHHGYANTLDLEIYNVLFLPRLVESDHELLQQVPGLFDFFMVEPWFRAETQFRYKLRLSPTTRIRMEERLSSLETELQARAAGYRAAAKGLFLEFLVDVGRAYASTPLVDGPDFGGKRSAVQQAIVFIERNYAGELSLGSISSQVLLSPNYFSAQFKQATGLSPWEYLTRVRLERAKALLRSTGNTITDVALSVGFGDSGYFSRVFKSREGMSPRSYRRLRQDI